MPTVRNPGSGRAEKDDGSVQKWQLVQPIYRFSFTAWCRLIKAIKRKEVKLGCFFSGKGRSWWNVPAGVLLLLAMGTWAPDGDTG